MSTRKIIFIFLLSVLPFVQTRAQGRFPVFKTDPAVSEGFLDNGMKYFVIENRSLGGTAEFALVQRTCQKGRDTLFLPSWDGSYAALFGRLGVAPSRRGYVESGDGYRMLRLRDVPVLEGGKVVDSLLFSLFSMARGTDASLQTVIVAGDISGKDILSRLRMFSMTVAATDGVTSPTGRHPDVMRGPVVNVMPDSSGLAVLRVSCRMPRFSRQRSGTVLYTVSLRMENIMEAIVSKSLRQILERDSIPVAGISFESGRRRADSVEDKYTIEISTRPEYIYEVAARTGELLRQLEREGVNYGAYSWAMSLVRGREWRHSASAPDNGAYVDKCLSAVLKGTDMASDAEKVRYFRGRDVPDSVSIVHFNRFLDAIIGNDPNLEIECRGAVDGISADSLLSRYRSAWPDGPQMPLFKVSGHDTLAFPSASKKKVKFSEPRADQVSGGLRWTYLRKKDNLLSVVYRKAATDGLMHYSLIFPGGAESLRGLGNGALAYIGDVFRLCDVGALDGEHFFTLLESAGITMECRVTLTDMCIEGCAPSSSFPLLLKSLVEVSTARKPSPAAFERYMLAQRMLSGRDSLSRVLMTVESRLHPGFGHSMLKNPDALVPEVRVAAETLFSNCFSRFDDAVLALVGDRSEYMVQKDIQVYADQFPTGGRRPQVERIPFRTLSGTASISGPGPDGLAVVAMSMPYSYNGDNLLLAETVTEAFRREICRRIAAAGCAAEVAMDFSPAPVEAVNVRVAINRIPSAGLPGVSGAAGVSDALAIVRVSLAAVASSLTAEEFGVCRKIVRARRDAAQSDPASIFEFIRVRSVSLKDINSSYQLKLDGLDLDAAKTFAGALSRSGRVEYVCE